MKRRNKALTVIFSFIPGAGQMWQGFLTSGVELMAAFFGIIFIAGLFNADLILLMLPIIYAYSFFESINRMLTEDEKFYELPDTLAILNGKSIIKNRKSLFTVGGICLIIFGFVALWNGTYSVVWSIFADYFSQDDVYMLYDIMSQVPKVVLSLGAIAGGILLIVKKKKEITDGDDK